MFVSEEHYVMFVREGDYVMFVSERQKLTHLLNHTKSYLILIIPFKSDINILFSSTFQRKKVELLSSLRRQRLGGLSFQLSFLSESISQKLLQVSI